MGIIHPRTPPNKTRPPKATKAPKIKSKKETKQKEKEDKERYARYDGSDIMIPTRLLLEVLNIDLIKL